MSEYKKELAETGGGSNAATTPSEMQLKIASFVGLVCSEGISEMEDCDVVGNSSTSNPSSKPITNTSSLDVWIIEQNSIEDEPISVASLNSDKRFFKRP